MVSAETSRSLLRHAGLDEHEGSLAPSVAEATRPGSEAPLDDAIADCMRALGHLNVELNGPVPSRSDRRAADVPREVALAVATVSGMLHASAREGAARAALRIDAAWRAVLGGDIDDLHAFDP